MQPDRSDLARSLKEAPARDLVVIGGGATGLGVALDAAARGLSVALVEAEDFAKGTSSRATKLAHGGVRYLAQGDLGLVREALHERTILMRNAPHLVQPLAFVLPVYGARGRWLDKWFYGGGLALYDLLAGKDGHARSEFLSAAQALERAPGLQGRDLAGAIQYWDGQFDDARLALALARTAIARGATVLNHCAAVGLIHENGRIGGVLVEDRETGARHELRTRCVINATGVWVDAIRRMDRAASGDLVAPSQGVHLVVDRAFLPSGDAGATKSLAVVGAPVRAEHPLSGPPGLHLYGTEAPLVQNLPGAQRELAPGLSEAMVRFAARHEYARTVEDVLARRSRVLFLDALHAKLIAPRVAALLQEELGARFDASASLQSFTALADRYSRLPQRK